MIVATGETLVAVIDEPSELFSFRKSGRRENDEEKLGSFLSLNFSKIILPRSKKPFVDIFKLFFGLFSTPGNEYYLVLLSLP
ncbi:unnamed protein product [Caenorhabditis auriculariae]|uniref:Uncharacterized protein n=1 Tax=Caenorhabditis auriculariae TaxID=2777116 RepID=A0A8S1HYZ4_9PELO|nr:unnamed protein product [Caenorhabditis auriculariae]